MPLLDETLEVFWCEANYHEFSNAWSSNRLKASLVIENETNNGMLLVEDQKHAQKQTDNKM